jgi:alginate O-acetyltransferase complex protein AlgI
LIYSEYDFLFLFPFFFVVFYSSISVAWQSALLLVGSAIFLGWTGYGNLLVAAGSVLFVLFYFKIAERFQTGKASMGAVIVLLVASLAYFKYRVFISDLTGIFIPAPTFIGWIIPLGISFYTFEAISAVIDLRRRRQTPGALNWSLFILFFPHLIAGPIVRYRQLSPQFETAKPLIWRNVNIGFHLFTLGFLKKLAADPIGQLIDPVWAAPAQASGVDLALALLGFYVQIYLDFSGYTDMGRGVARMLGYRLPINFRAPFFAASPPDLFRRWHVSLSSWIRTFVYETLAVAVLRRVRSRTRQNWSLLVVVILVMAIFGLWHGAAWHFVVFGIWLGVLVVGWQIVTKGKMPKTRGKWILSVVILQLCWFVGLILFRSDDLVKAGQFFAGLGSTEPSGGGYGPLYWCLAAVAGAFAVQLIDYYATTRPVAARLLWLRADFRGFLLVLAVFAASLSWKIDHDADVFAGAASGPREGFIYFRF